MELGWFTGTKALKMLSWGPCGVEHSGAHGWGGWALLQLGAGTAGEGDESGRA